MDQREFLNRVETAIHTDNVTALQRYLAEIPDLKARINEPILCFASPPILLAKSRPVVDLLLQAGADINAKSNWWAGGFGFLHTAPKELAFYGLERGAKLDIHAAARLGLAEEVKGFLRSNPDLINSRGGDGQTPLHFASTVEVAKVLLDHGADLDALDIDHESTPAQYMVRDRQEIARYLIKQGCKTDILMASALGLQSVAESILNKNPQAIETTVSNTWFPKRNPHSGGIIYIWTLGNNKSPHAVAKEFGHNELLEFLLSRSSLPLRFALACELKDFSLAKHLLEQHTNIINQLSPELLRKLPQAAENNDAVAVGLMLDCGWPVGVKARHDATALHWAGFHGNKAMAEALIKHGASLSDTENEFNSSPLGWAIHGSEHGWYRLTGDYAGTVEVMLAVGARHPGSVSGSPAVEEVLRAALSSTAS